ncbi:ABC transporter substrate-binding protein [Actinomycetota bacterium Odt1-20B]
MPSGRTAAARLSVAVTLSAALCLAVSGCQSGGGSAAPDEASRDGGGYPVTVTNCGTTHTYEKAPSRVVVMNGGSVAEVSSLLALGLGDRIVANAQSYGRSEVKGRAKAVAALPTGGIKLNEAMDIPREPMLGLRPDFVMSTWGGGFAASGGFATREDLETAGAGAYTPHRNCSPSGDDGMDATVEDSYAMLRDLGRIFDVRQRAERLITASKQRIAAASKAVEATGTKGASGTKRRPRVMVTFAGMNMGTNDFSSVAAHGVYNDILAKAGGTNAFAGASKTMFADLSKEQVAAEPVDALVVISYRYADPDAYARKVLRQFPQWPAAKKKRYVVLSDSMYLGPSSDLAVERIARLLHPEAF